MNLLLTRYSDNGNSTQGIMHIMEKSKIRFLNYTLEDEFREVKIMHETCIPTGLYEIKQRKVLSPKTKRYRAKFNWFDWHLELQNVEGFENIYIHLGNKETDTSGCILVSDTANNNTVNDAFNGSSTVAFERFYNMVKDELKEGSKVFIRIRTLD